MTPWTIHVRNYWNEVYRVLREDHNLGRLEAAGSIKYYRRLLHENGIGDIVYHETPDEIAQDIIAGEYTVTGFSCMLLMVFAFGPFVLSLLLPDKWITPKLLNVTCLVYAIFVLGFAMGLFWLHQWFMLVILVGFAYGLGYLASVNGRQ